MSHHPGTHHKGGSMSIGPSRAAVRADANKLHSQLLKKASGSRGTAKDLATLGAFHRIAKKLGW